MSRGPVRNSKVWDFFEHIREGGFDGYKCIVNEKCNWKNGGRNHTNCTNHLRNHHNSVYHEIMKKDENISIETFAKKVKFSYDEELNEKFVNLFAHSVCPFQIVENEEFMNLMIFLKPDVKTLIPSRHTLMRLIHARFASEMTALVSKLNSLIFFSISCDIWSRKNFSASYLGVTVQFYDKSTRSIQNKAMELIKLNQSHTAENVRNQMDHVMAKYFDDHKVLRCVTDAGANMIKVYKPALIADESMSFEDECDSVEIDRLYESSDSEEFEEESAEKTSPEVLEVDQPTETEHHYNSQNIKRFNCVAHVLNTVCSKSLDHSGTTIHTIKQKVMKFVNQFSHSGKKTEHLLQKTDKHLVRFAKTRWNYFYYVCKRLLEIKAPLIQTCSEIDLVIDFSWVDIESIAEILKPLAELTNILQANGATISKVIPEILDLKETLSLMEKPKFKDDIESFLATLDQKTGYIFQEDGFCFDPIFCMASVLDPKQSLKLTDELYKLGKDQLLMYARRQTIENDASTQVVTAQTGRRRSTSTPARSNNRFINQLNDYFGLIDAGCDIEENPLVFWDNNLQRFPDMAPHALQILSLASTSAAPERIFSVAGMLSSNRRSKTNSETLRVRTILTYNK